MLRILRKVAQDNPPKLLTISVGNLLKLTEKIKQDILLRASCLYPNLQIKPQSAVSCETYFENNHGFKEPAKLLIKPTPAIYSSPLYDNFLSKNVKSPYLVPNRSFKTVRGNIETQKSLFDQFREEPSQSSNASTQYPLGSIFKDLSPNEVNEQVNKAKLDNLKPEEQEKLDLGKLLTRLKFVRGCIYINLKLCIQR